MYLGNLSQKLPRMGYHDESIDTRRESIGLYRVLARDRPGIGVALLPRSIGNLAFALCERGYHEEALATAREAVEISRQLSKDEPSGIHPTLVFSLKILCVPLIHLNRLQEYEAAVSESDVCLRALMLAEPGRFASPLDWQGPRNPVSNFESILPTPGATAGDPGIETVEPATPSRSIPIYFDANEPDQIRVILSAMMNGPPGSYILYSVGPSDYAGPADLD